MFLHIGNNVLLNKTEIIGVFNIDALIVDAKGKKFLADVRASEKTVDISDGKQTSIVLTNNETYISRISTATLLGRSGAGALETLTSAAKATRGRGRKKTAPKVSSKSVKQAEEFSEEDDVLIMDEPEAENEI
ncbi:MAG TPA: DUF370 domain-containing protein [bacterium]|nr:DUF370 domain-containing protein [bacterium]